MSNTYNKCWLIVSIALIVLPLLSQSQEKWKKDMELSTHHGGGKRLETKTVIINNSSCAYIQWRLRKTDTLTFTLSTQELDDLLKEINASHFRDIISGEMGPESIAWDSLPHL
jgi:hypothetical protein